MRYRLVSNDGTMGNVTLYDENNRPVSSKHELSIKPSVGGHWEMATVFQVFSNLEVVTIPTRIKSIEINGNELIIETVEE